MLILPLGKNDGAQDGHQDQERGELEGINEFGENLGGKFPGGSERSAGIGGGETERGTCYGGRNQTGNGKSDRNARVSCQVRKVGALFLPGVQQHDDEDEKHHDSAAVNDDLHGGNEIGAQQQIQTGERNHDHDQRERAVNRMALQDQADGAENGKRGEN